jgi:hypothetical protein
VSKVGLIDRNIGLMIEFVLSAPDNKNGKHGSPESRNKSRNESQPRGNDGRIEGLAGKKNRTETEAIKARTKAMRDKRVEANLNACLKQTMACQVTTEACPIEQIQRRWQVGNTKSKVRKNWNPERNVKWSLRKRSQ